MSCCNSCGLFSDRPSMYMYYRFGKFTKVLFENMSAAALKATAAAAYRPRIVGSYIETYLLEKTRVVQQGKGERNYHIFYQLCRGMAAATDPADQALGAECKVADPKDFFYLDQSGTYDITGVSDAEKFRELRVALSSLSFDRSTQDDIFRVVAGVLHLGNVSFDTSDLEAVKINASANNSSEDSLDYASTMFGVSDDALRKRLTTSSIKVGAQVIVKPLRADDAVYNRDAMTKALYHGLFNWLVAKMNAQLVVR